MNQYSPQPVDRGGGVIGEPVDRGPGDTLEQDQYHAELYGSRDRRAVDRGGAVYRRNPLITGAGKCST